MITAAKTSKRIARRLASLSNSRLLTRHNNGVSERVGRTLCAMVRCMRVDSGLPQFLWGELIMAASYIFNRIPHSALNMETPYKKLYGKDTYLSQLKIIGARAFVHIKNPNKLGHTSWEGMVYGFSETESNSYRIWNPKTRRVVESRNAVLIKTPQNLLPARPGDSRRYKISSHRRTIAATTCSTTTTSRATTCCGTYRTTPPLWISASTRLPER